MTGVTTSTGVPASGTAGTANPKIRQVCVQGHTFSVNPKYDLNGARILGRGSYGVVTTATDTTENLKLAIKRIRPYANDEWDARHTLREVRLLKLLGPHPNVITLYDLSLFEEKTELYMMMEVMDSDLHHIIQSKQPLSDMHHKCFAKQLLEGIKAMHSIGVFHRDLKPGNLLVSKDCKLRITDFGLARFMDETTLAGNNAQNPLTEYVVTRWYRCPELLLAPNRPYSEAIDLWSIGCILAELIRRKPLFPGSNHANQVQLIFEVMGFSNVSELGFSVSSEALNFLNRKCRFPKKQLADILPQASPEAVSLISSLLCVNPRRRPTAAQALAADYVKDATTFNDYSLRYLRPPPPGYFDFETAEHSLEQLKTLIHEEVGFAGRIGHLGPKHAARQGAHPDELTLGSMRMSSKSGMSGRSDRIPDGRESAAPTQMKGYHANESSKSMRSNSNFSNKAARNASIAESASERRDSRCAANGTETMKPAFMNNSATDYMNAVTNAVGQMNVTGGRSSAGPQQTDRESVDLDRNERSGSSKKPTPRNLEPISKTLSRNGSAKGLENSDGGAISGPSTTSKIESEQRAMNIPQQLKPLARHGSNPMMMDKGRSGNGIAEGATNANVVTKKKSYSLLPVAFGFQSGASKDAPTNDGNSDALNRSGPFPNLSRIGSMMGVRTSSNMKNKDEGSRHSSGKNNRDEQDISLRSQISVSSSMNRAA